MRQAMNQHLREAHGWENTRRGRPSTASDVSEMAFKRVTSSPVTCQTFYANPSLRCFFPVCVQAPAGHCPLNTTPQPLTLRDQVLQELAQKSQAAQAAQEAHTGERHVTEVSPWLDLTQWITYLSGYSSQGGLSQAIRLIDLPGRSPLQAAEADDSLLSVLLSSFDRVIEQARESLVQGRLNVFDQHRVNSFLPRRSAAKPLLFRLQENTYKKYKKVWRQLLCFVYRLAWKQQGPNLHYCLTSAQATALEQVMQAVTAVGQSLDEPLLQQQLDHACLLLCIALLDHPLYSNIYDSIVIGFFAVLGIKENRGTAAIAKSFYEATAYTPYLSAFVKMA